LRIYTRSKDVATKFKNESLDPDLALFRVFVIHKLVPCTICVYKKLSYRRETARRAMSVKMLLTAAQSNEKSQLEWLATGE